MEYIQEAINILLQRFPGLQAVYLFGSQAGPGEHPESDVDLALLLSPEHAKQVSKTYLFHVRTELEKVLNLDVDLINLRMANTVLQKEVVSTGQRIYCSDNYAAELFELLAFSAYQKLCQERAGIVQEIVKSGKVLADE
ncbi:MAG: type VII toxin-antitoxin system MntA family adenylyltransferase antitoxin [Desulfohalobiaceae bacterium]